MDQHFAALIRNTSSIHQFHRRRHSQVPGSLDSLFFVHYAACARCPHVLISMFEKHTLDTYLTQNRHDQPKQSLSRRRITPPASTVYSTIPYITLGAGASVFLCGDWRRTNDRDQQRSNNESDESCVRVVCKLYACTRARTRVQLEAYIGDTAFVHHTQTHIHTLKPHHQHPRTSKANERTTAATAAVGPSHANIRTRIYMTITCPGIMRDCVAFRNV